MFNDINKLRQILEDQQLSIKQPSRFVERALDISKHIEDEHTLVISGVRRSGKSELLHDFHKNHDPAIQTFYLRLDDPRLQNFEAQNFEVVYQIWREKFARDTRPCFLLDEVQMIKGWERWVNYFSDQEKIKVIVTGSNASMLSSELGTLLTGRHRSLELYPFSFSELADASGLGAPDLASLQGRAGLRALHEEYLKFGGFPRAWLDRDTSILEQYFSDIILRDIVARRNLRDPRIIVNVATTLMTNNTAIINKTRLAEQSNLKSPETVSKYVNFLEECYLLFEMRKFSFSLRKQKRNLTKPYAIDTAMAVEAGFTFFDKSGSLLENQVFLELKRRGANPFYWHSRQNHEVDFLALSRNKPLSAIQASYSLSDEATLNREIRALLDAHVELGVKDLLIITLDEERTIRRGEVTVKCLPFYAWALQDDLGGSPLV